MERLIKPKVSYWAIGYLIPYNHPQYRYSHFKQVEDIFNDNKLRFQPDDYIFRISKEGVPFIYYRFTNEKIWLRRKEVLEYDRNIKYKHLNYIQ